MANLTRLTQTFVDPAAKNLSELGGKAKGSVTNITDAIDEQVKLVDQYNT